MSELKCENPLARLKPATKIEESLKPIIKPGGDAGYEYDATARYRSATVVEGNHMANLKAAIAQRFSIMNQRVSAVEDGKERRMNDSSDWSDSDNEVN